MTVRRSGGTPAAATRCSLATCPWRPRTWRAVAADDRAGVVGHEGKASTCSPPRFVAVRSIAERERSRRQRAHHLRCSPDPTHGQGHRCPASMGHDERFLAISSATARSPLATTAAAPRRVPVGVLGIERTWDIEKREDFQLVSPDPTQVHSSLHARRGYVVLPGKTTFHLHPRSPGRLPGCDGVEHS